MSVEAKKLFAFLDEKGLLEYGSVIPVSMVREVADLQYPESGSYKEFKELELRELSIVGWMKDKLLNEGKTIVQRGDSYRIPLASENAYEAERLHAAANRKTARAEKLLRNTPLPPHQRPNNSRTRSQRKQEHRRIPGQPIP